MTIKLMDIVVDPTIQVRGVESHTVSKYAQAMRAGAEFPQMVIEADTNRLVCGNHRYYAMKTAYGPEHSVYVQSMEFDTEADLIRFAAKDNTGHGRPLDTWDQKRITARLQGYGDTPEDIAELLSVPVSKVEQWSGMTVVVRGTKPKSKLQHLPVKHGVEHMAGQTVTQEAYTEHERRDPGIPVKNMAAVITRHIESGWIDTTDYRTMANLEALYTALAQFIKEQAA